MLDENISEFLKGSPNNSDSDMQGQIFIIFREGWKNVRLGASHAMCYSGCFGRGMKWQTKVDKAGEVAF